MIKDIKNCAIDVVSEIEEPLSKQSIFDELPFDVNIQQCFDMPNMETNVLSHEQLFMDETCKNELDVAHYFTFKDSFNSCLPIVESNGVSEVVLKNGFNCDISSNM